MQIKFKKLKELREQEQQKKAEYYNRRYGRTFKSEKTFSLVLSFLAVFTPSLIRAVLLDEESILKQGAELNGLETFAQIAEIIYILVMVFSFAVAVLSSALGDIYCHRLFSNWVKDCLSDQFDVDPLTLRLCTAGNVDAYRTLHRFVFGFYMSYSEYHLAAFEHCSLVAILASALVFGMSFLNVDFNVGTALLFRLGCVITCSMTCVFYNIAKTHSILVSDVVPGLNFQKRKNNIELNFQDQLAHGGDEEKI